MHLVSCDTSALVSYIQHLPHPSLVRSLQRLVLSQFRSQGTTTACPQPLEYNWLSGIIPRYGRHILLT